jgi:hypothetical protein
MLTERFIWQHGHKRRVMHLAGFDRLGRFAGALCGMAHIFDRSCNLPLGRRVCKRCKSVERNIAA